MIDSDSMGERVGFIGLGNMGSPMAQRLLDAGFDLTVYDVRGEVARTWNAGRCMSAATLSEVGDSCDTVCMSLPTPDVVEKVVLGKDGLAICGRVDKVIDLSTTGPAVSQAVGRGLAENGKTLIDAPVSGGVAGARAGTLAVMAACSQKDFVSVEPLLRNIGRVFHVGAAPGMGQMMKLLNNLLSAAAMVLSSEVAVMGVKAGLDADTMMNVFNAGSGRNSATQDKFPRTILPRRFDYGFTNRLMTKDVNLCLEQAERLGLHLPAASAVRETWVRTLSEIGANEDFTTVVKLYERQAGVEVKGAGVGAGSGALDQT
jgi:3-hydroxyisobutyrate dehydrogenase-like beta-hydroxyacid dehydrogenase